MHQDAGGRELTGLAAAGAAQSAGGEGIAAGGTAAPDAVLASQVATVSNRLAHCHSHAAANWVCIHHPHCTGFQPLCTYACAPHQARRAAQLRMGVWSP